MAETGKRGPETGAADHHRDLRKKGCDQCNFELWNNLSVRAGAGITGWQVQVLSSHEYQVVPG